ncbi:hypothetical protein evm_000353 [Chilo suppressalis]|nr:hypothetical protein evm_000353 [Chilo suppressalis]
MFTGDSTGLAPSPIYLCGSNGFSCLRSAPVLLDKSIVGKKCYLQTTAPLRGTPPNGPHTWLPQVLRAPQWLSTEDPATLTGALRHNIR